MHADIDTAAACLDRGDLAQAERICRLDLASNSDEPSARALLGRILRASGKFEEAQTEFRRAVQARPTFVEAWVQWAALLESGGHAENARECLALGLKHAPDSHALHNDIALIYLTLKEFAAAAFHARRAVALLPHSAASHFNLGLVCRAQGNLKEAVAAFREAVHLNPSAANFHYALGETLIETDRSEARQALEKVLALQPRHAEAIDRLGSIDAFEGQIEEALAKFELALAWNPSLMRAVGHKTNALFLQGRLPEAWALYRRRFEVAAFKHDPHGRFSAPKWQGEVLDGKSLLIWTESGLGEEVLQAGMFHDVLKRVSRLTVECSPRLESLFKRSFPGVTIIPRTNPSRACSALIEADFQMAGGDIGGWLRDAWPRFTPHSGYLVPPTSKVEELKKKYRAAPLHLVVGLSWASVGSGLSKSKTLDLNDCAPILGVSGIRFVNLQHGANPSDVTAVAESLGAEILTDPTIDPKGDMDDVAAQVAAMDLVISVSNTAVHVAGALNVPVWNIVPGYNATGMWHWFGHAERSPWYPAMRLYRRNTPRVDELMGKIAEALETEKASRLAARQARS